ncbi:MAG TPA: disulfide oxidoreductase [Thermoanaerobaculia bacterium]|nr:disulfide oxidoreductase [Thermoanaerobaculia bacterium]
MHARFAARMTVREALALHPHAQWVFAAWHLRGCCQCSAADGETLAEVAAGYQISLESFLADLNSLPLLEADRQAG